MISTFMRSLLQKFDENKFMDQPTKCKFDICEYERLTLKKIPESLKTTLLITKTKRTMNRDLCMQIDDVTMRQRTSTMIVMFCRTSTLTTNIYTGRSRGAEAGTAHMEIDAFYHRKNKGKGKGKKEQIKGKSKGKGKGKGLPHHDGGKHQR